MQTMSSIGTGGGQRPPSHRSGLHVGEQVVLAPGQTSQPSAEMTEFMAAGPVFVDEISLASGGNELARVVNSRGQVELYGSSWLVKQSAPLVGAIFPGPTLPVLGEVVRLAQGSRKPLSRASVFDSAGQVVVEKVNGTLAELRNEATGETDRLSTGHLQRVPSPLTVAAGTPVPEGQAPPLPGVDLADCPRLGARGSNRDLAPLMERFPGAQVTLEEVVGGFQALFPRAPLPEVVDAGLAHFHKVARESGQSLEALSACYRTALQAARHMPLRRPGELGALTELVTQLLTEQPEQGRELFTEMLRASGDFAAARELWAHIRGSQDPQALARVRRCFELAPSVTAGANTALVALESPGRLDLMAYLLETGGEQPHLAAQQGLDCARQMQLSRDELPWLQQVLGWCPHPATAPGLTRLTLDQPEAQRQECLDFLRAIYQERLRSMEPQQAGRAALEQGGALLTLQQEGTSLRDVAERFERFRAEWDKSKWGEQAPEAFARGGLARQDRLERWLHLVQNQVSCSDGVRCLELEARDDPLYSRSERQLMVDRLVARLKPAAGAVNFDALRSDMNLLTSARPAAPDLEQRLNLLELARSLSPGQADRGQALMALLERDWPDHEATVKLLRERSELCQTGYLAALARRFPGESTPEALDRLGKLGEQVPQGAACQAFVWLSEQPRERAEVLQAALVRRLEARHSLDRVTREFAEVQRLLRPDQDLAQCLGNLEFLQGKVPEDRVMGVYEWASQPSRPDFQELVQRLTAQARLTGSLDRALEILDRPLSGIRETEGAVMVGGVRLKRRS